MPLLLNINSNLLYTMKKINKKKLTNKGRILGRLLRSPKTTAELARGLGYIDTNGVARYNVINKDLKSLEASGYIKREKIKLEKKPGNTPALYSIVLNINNLNNIYEKYPYLLGNIQRSEVAFETIFCEYSDLIYTATDKKYVEQIENLKVLVEKSKEDFKEKLKSSPEFFKIFLMNDKYKLMHRIRKIIQTTGEQANAEIFIIDDDPQNRVMINETIYGINMLFKASVIVDIANGQSIKKAREYIAKMEKEASDVPKID